MVIVGKPLQTTIISFVPFILGVVEKLYTYYKAFVEPSKIKMVSSVSSGHAFVSISMELLQTGS